MSLLHLFQRLSRLFSDQSIDLGAQLLDLLGVNLDLRCHAARAAHGLVDEVVRVGQADAPLPRCGEHDDGCRAGHQAHSDHGDLGLHETHHVENGVPRIRVPAGGVDVYLDRILALLFQEDEGANDPLRELLVDLPGNKDGAGLEHAVEEHALIRAGTVFLFDWLVLHVHTDHYNKEFRVA